ncbi:MAG: hypothetical protein AAF519_19265 [Bacteroidota bacterium]
MLGIIFFGIQSRSGYLAYQRIAYLGTHQKYLLIKDKVYFIGRDGEGEPRFYWINMENGQVLFRKGIDRTNTSFLSYSEKFIHYKTKDEICVVDIETGDLVEFSEDEVTTLLSNDNEGLYRYTFDPKNLTITLKDNKGKIYQDSLKALFPAATLPVTLDEDFTEHARIGDGYADLNAIFFKLQGGTRKILVDTDGKTLQPEQVFIAPMFMRTYEVGTDTTANITVIHSYETLEKATFIVSVLDETGNLLWEFTGSETDDLWSGSNAAFIFPYQDNLLFIIEDRLLSFHALTGKLNWKKRI